MIMSNTLKNMLACGCDRLPLCGHYAYLLALADTVTHSREQSRKQCGLYTYRQWNEFLTSNNISL